MERDQEQLFPGTFLSKMENAISVLRKAKEKANNKLSRVITDMYRGYPRAFRLVFDPRKIKHVPSGSHGRIERLMKVVKKRLKQFPCFHSHRTAENFSVYL